METSALRGTHAVTRTPITAWRLTLADAPPGSPAQVVAALEGGVDAAAPGSVLGALINAGLASDVTVDGREEDVAWASEATWIYRASVPRHGDGSLARLAFDGVDTIATVRVDGVVALTTDDMFHGWKVDLGIDDAPGTWEVEVEFASVLPVIEDAQARNPLPRADMYEIPFNQVRKMASSFGWDWGPTTITAGLWRVVHIERTPVGRIANLLLSPTWTDGARLHATVTVEGPVDHVEIHVRDPHTGHHVGSGVVPIDNGAGELDLAVGDARRWDVVGRGEQPLYDAIVVAHLADGEVVDTAERRIGFRNVALVQRPDAAGVSCEITVNGARVWARGFNWIPADVLPERVTPAHVRALVEEAVATGANMLRVWGGGVIESDAFYDACDELGVLVWQDFSFACATYAEDDDQLARVTREAEDAVGRVGHRASLVLWCGCNENLWGWEDWGWKESMGESAPWGARIYYETIPSVLAVLDPQRPYIPGSPFSPDRAAHPNDGASGTTHHWDTWNQLDYVAFEGKESRFAAEFGWQAPASWPTLVQALGREPRSGDDPELQRHQKHPQGNAALARAVADHVPHLPIDGPGWYFSTQLVQARALSASIGRFRSLHDTCSGALWWQLDDCWPALSWSVIDVARRRKLGWYAARATMAARAVIATAPSTPYGLTLVNDVPESWTACGELRVVAEDGTVLRHEPIDVTIPADGHVVLTPHEVPDAAAVVVVDVDGIRGSRWIVPDLELSTAPALVASVALETAPGVARVTIRAAGLIRDLCVLAELDPALANATVDRQLELLLPGESVTFTVTGPRVETVPTLRWVSLLAAGTQVKLA